MILRIYWGGISFGDECCTKPPALSLGDNPWGSISPFEKQFRKDMLKPYDNMRQLSE